MFAALLALAAPAISVDNISDGTEIRYPLVLLKGSASGSTIKVNGLEFPVVDGKYRALVELKPGKNDVKLLAGSSVGAIKLAYKPATTKYRVEPIWLVSKDGDGSYYTTFPGRDQKKFEKFDLALKMMQSFSAEAMNDAGYGRKTFSLDFDGKGMVKVRQVRLPKTTAELHAMEDGQIWSLAYDTIKTQLPEATTKWAALLSATSFDPATKKNLSHFALGGGALACFGAGSMDYWPATLGELPKVWADGTVIESGSRFEDSAGRSTVWANVSTAYGAFLHELGHTFGLPHTADRYGIMSRGFDFFNRRFVIVEPPSKHHAEPMQFGPTEMAYWDPHFAARLNWSKWFQPDRTDTKDTPGPRIRVDGDKVIFTASQGIRVIGAESDSLPAVWRQFMEKDAPKQASWSLNWLRNRIGGKGNYRITVVDGDGNQATYEDKRG
ncbi:MAG: hypothetical protein BGO01_15880 [Armatimonadetes bacterium 55-13]|nr:hypothetical protein [Armatimonadota bacterium]OJU65339.1 MAG: hypothetical protein BGO01_15880 [Armatimonadetes bacterium 55-13]